MSWLYEQINNNNNNDNNSKSELEMEKENRPIKQVINIIND